MFDPQQLPAWMSFHHRRMSPPLAMVHRILLRIIVSTARKAAWQFALMT